ncbi:N-acetylmuramoyl-L-alanine amidase [Nocardioides alkalitolerans]|uniref:N-acetylmuramoyl-L-alanine amidase n=1 Tax=Nocardioides alkalitolerans TaxID=281714 RepID=UPI000422F697|nr:N-acetylmuramoyl-L-alanine amidase [Nocardioides alkalitolerans]
MQSVGRHRWIALAAVVVAVVLVVVVVQRVGPTSDDTTTPPVPSVSPSVDPSADPTAALPLAGRVVVVDPGHQLGNGRQSRLVNQLVDAGGGLRKPCNSTGTASDDGLPEATVNFAVAQRLVARLEQLGATVELTRTTNSAEESGPCVDARGRAGRPGADLLVSLHADGAAASDRGFHVIAPGPLTGDGPSRTDVLLPEAAALASTLRDELLAAGFPTAPYVEGGLDERSDLGTLNLSQVPAAMVEMGNLRNADDAALLGSEEGQQAYADAIASGVVAWVGADRPSR